jgi:multidrug efflux system membrane fusion protein
MRRRIAFLVCTALLTVAGCSKPEPAPEPVRSVKLITIATSANDGEQVFAGDVRARVESRLGFRVGGKILKRQAEIGQLVKAGEPLAQLDPQDLRLAADAARAQAAAARTNRDLASADFKRYAALKAENFISGAELDRREATLKSAQASLDQAQAQLAAQGNQAGYAVLRADAPGVITGVDAEPGQVVAAGAPVVRLAQDGQRDAVFAVPEDQVRRFATGQSVEVRTWSNPSAPPIAARVREVGAAADPVTRTFTVKVALDGAALPLGSTVSITATGVDSGGKARIRIPTSALRRDGEKTTVWLLDEPTMTVHEQTVVVSGIDGNDVTIQSGLKPGMRIVAAGVHVLAPGQKVLVYEGNSALANENKGQPAINKEASGASVTTDVASAQVGAGVLPTQR